MWGHTLSPYPSMLFVLIPLPSWTMTYQPTPLAHYPTLLLSPLLFKSQRNSIVILFIYKDRSPYPVSISAFCFNPITRLNNYIPTSHQGGQMQVKVKFLFSLVISLCFPFFPVVFFFQHKNNTILINKWPPPPLQPSFHPFLLHKAKHTSSRNRLG